MSAGVVAIDLERLEAFAGALADAADELLAVRAAARGLGAPDLGILGAAAHALDEGATEARRGAAVVRLLPTVERPPHTGALLGRTVPAPHPAAELARRLVEVRRLLRLRHVGPVEVGNALDRFLAAVGDDPRAAAAALEVLGVGGLRAAYELAAAEAGDLAALDGPGRRAVEERFAAVTRVALLASRTIDEPGGLPRRFVDDLLPGAGAGGPSGVSQLLAAAGAGQYFAEAAASAVGSGRVGLVVRAGRVLAFGGLAVGVVEALADGGEGLGEALLTSGLGVVGALAGGPVGWLAGGLSLVLTVALAVGARPGRPPARTYPTDRPSPGGSHYDRHVDGAGVPVNPAGG